MQEKVSGYIHHDKKGYLNNYKEYECRICGCIKRIDYFYPIKSS